MERKERKKASDFPHELLELFDGYVHGDINRRQFLRGAEKFATAAVTAGALFEMLRPNYAWAITVQPDDPRIKSETPTVASPKGNGEIKGYLARPAKDGRFPAIIVIHENRGLNPYIEDIARRLAVLGYVAFAPDGLTPVGGYPGDENKPTDATFEEKATDLFNKLDKGKMFEDFVASAYYVKARPEGTGKLGAIGFCFGGGVVVHLAERLGADLSAATPFYPAGAQPDPAEVAKIKAPIDFQYAGLDTGITSLWPGFDKLLTANGVPHEGHIYQGANHGFHNDTTPRYDEAAATAAWASAQGWFKKYLA